MANAINEARTAIEAQFETEFTNLFTAVKVATDNTKEFAQETGKGWVRLSVQHTGRIQETLGKEGKRRFRSSGSVFIQIFTPIGGGDNVEKGQEMKRSDELASKAAEVFDAGKVLFQRVYADPGPPHGQQPAPVAAREPFTVYFEAATTRESGIDGKWFAVLVEVPFEYDEIR